VQRRAKPAELLGVTPAVASAATWTLDGLTYAHGNPLCASVRPPLIEWSAATE